MTPSNPPPETDRGVLDTVLRNALTGKDAHVDTRTVFDALDWTLAGLRPGNVPHSTFQLLNHMVHWQEWVVKWLDGEDPPIARHASDGWPGGAAPTTASEWDGAVERFRQGLDGLGQRAREADLIGGDDAKSRLEMLHAIASHNSYHAGQVALLRQMLGAWPPPSGGLTW